MVRFSADLKKVRVLIDVFFFKIVRVCNVSICLFLDVFQDEENEDFLSISRAMEEIVDDPIDCYWLIKCFVNQFHTKFGDSVPHLVSVPYSLMEKGVELQQADFSLSATLI